ncbi:recombinase family protein [Candidatus Contubernalis alkaliaceticus]|uniref:recombinase family protein n=1 Tax=Candidatus Contubernalis alkaliaceticus TaxID=338645 RepID=UPI001F4C2D5E|nr:recombinase family protein [Candidatus Contubernalis alkalaceticus]UNC92703.1 recombinase family protein [Candidatus Contubernalis alkalaceticus]
MRAVAYCRVSTDTDDQKNSLTNQIQHYSKLFQQKGFNPPKLGMFFKKEGRKEIKNLLDNGIFADEGISGTKLKNRKAFEYLMDCAKKKEFDVIFVKDVRRWGRSVEDGVKALKDLKELGINVFFEEGNLNYRDQEFFVNMFLNLAQEESRQKSESIQWGIRKAQEVGKWNSQPPFGYDIIDGYLQKNESEIKIVKKIYDLYVNENFGTSKICRILNKENIPTKNNVQWSQTQVCKILDNEIYTGKQITHTIRTDDINRNLKEVISPEKWIINQKSELKIIDDETFLKAKKLRQEKKELNKRNQKFSDRHLLSNLLYCGNCNSAMRRKKRNSYTRKKDGTKEYKDIGYSWTCQKNDMYGKAKCPFTNMVVEEDLIEKIKQRIYIMQKEKHILDDNFDKYIENNFTYEDSDKRLEEINKEIDKLHKKVDLNFDLLSDKTIKQEEYKIRNDILQNKLSELKGEKNKLDHLEQELELAKVKFREYCKSLKEVDINNLSNAILKQLVDRITITTTKQIADDVSDGKLEEMNLSRDLYLRRLNVSSAWNLKGKRISIDWRFVSGIIEV